MDLWAEFWRSEASQTSQALHRSLPSKMARTSSDMRASAGEEYHTSTDISASREEKLFLETTEITSPNSLPTRGATSGFVRTFEGIILHKKRGDAAPYGSAPSGSACACLQLELLHDFHGSRLNRVTVLRGKTPRYNRGKSDDPGIEQPTLQRGVNLSDEEGMEKRDREGSSHQFL